MNHSEYTQQLINKVIEQSHQIRINLVQCNFPDYPSIKYAAGKVSGMDTAISIMKEVHDSIINNADSTYTINSADNEE